MEALEEVRRQVMTAPRTELGIGVGIKRVHVLKEFRCNLLSAERDKSNALSGHGVALTLDVAALAGFENGQVIVKTSIVAVLPGKALMGPGQKTV